MLPASGVTLKNAQVQATSSKPRHRGFCTLRPSISLSARVRDVGRISRTDGMIGVSDDVLVRRSRRRAPSVLLEQGNAMSSRFPIRFERWYRAVSRGLFLLPSDSYVEVRDDDVECRMGWAFRATFRRAAVARTARVARKPVSRGVHGFAGRWLVNGSAAPILAIDLEPAQRARVLGVPVTLRQLLVSVDDPDALADQLKAH